MTVKLQLILLAAVGVTITIASSCSCGGEALAQTDSTNSTDSGQNTEEVAIHVEGRTNTVFLAYRLAPAVAIVAAFVGFIIWKQRRNKS